MAAPPHHPGHFPRLCFRLEEPVEREEPEENEQAGVAAEKEENKRSRKEAANIEISEGMWYVRYLLQPYGDPSLLIPVKEAGILLRMPEDEKENEKEVEEAPFSPEPLPLDPEAFWGISQEASEGERGLTLKANIPKVPATLPKRLGKFPFWRGEKDLLEVLEEIYIKASPAGMMISLEKKMSAKVFFLHFGSLRN